MKSEISERLFNTFSGYKASYVSNWIDDMEFIEPWLYHLEKHLCAGDNNVYEYLLDWLQIIFKTPRIKTTKILVFVSEKEQKGGKGTFWRKVKYWKVLSKTSPAMAYSSTLAA